MNKRRKNAMEGKRLMGEHPGSTPEKKEGASLLGNHGKMRRWKTEYRVLMQQTWPRANRGEGESAG